MQRQTSLQQQGAITLVLITAMVVLALAATVSGGQRVWLDRLSTRNLYEREQAQWVAEAGLQWVARALQGLHGNGQLDWPVALQSPCPVPLQGPARQCLRWSAPAPASTSNYTLTVWAMRDVRQHPHVAQLLAQSEDNISHARAWLTRSLHLPVLGRASTATTPNVVLDSCTGSTPSWWPALMGQITGAQLQAWSALQQQMGLSVTSTAPRSVYWISTPGNWTTPVGSSSNPVLLVFDGAACTPQCPALQAPIVGTVLYLAQCRTQAITAMATSLGQVQGQVAMQASQAPPGLSVQGSAVAAAYALPHVSDNPTQVLWVPGSWSDASP